MRPKRVMLAAAMVLTGVTQAWARPIPFGEASVRFSYPTAAGVRMLEGMFDYSGAGPGSVRPLGGDPNIGYFNSVNNFGRRMVVPGALYADESLLTHAFFKPPGNATNYFSGITENGWVRLEVRNIHLDRPGWVQRDTILLHKLWDADQVDLLPQPYIHVHNVDTQTDPFRDEHLFEGLIFHHLPVPNFRLGTLSGPNAVEVFGDGTNEIGFSVTIPYSMFKNFEEQGQTVPPGLPAPFGFLEPFHFHLEFTVSEIPEPAAGMMLLAAGMAAIGAGRRRPNRR